MTLADNDARLMISGLAFVLLTTALAMLAQEAVITSPPLIIQPGTILTVRTNEVLSSDRNQRGDVFSATLAQPVVVQGIVVAQRGQTVAGRVVEAKKAGMVSGVSRLAIALTNMTLVDGQSVPMQSHLLIRNGPTSTERDVAAVAGSTGLGAAVGGVAGWGEGAAIGAGAGAVAGTIGVLLTRGHSTVLYPETLLTFQLTAPVTIHTDVAPEAFHSVKPEDYEQAQLPEREHGDDRPPVQVPPAYPYPYIYYAPPYYPYYDYSFYYSPYYYPYPYFLGPSFSVLFAYPRYHGFHYHFPDGGYYNYRPYYGHRGFYSPYMRRPFPHAGALPHAHPRRGVY